MFFLKMMHTSLSLSVDLVLLTVRRDVQENDEEAVRVKEQSILELGTLLAKTGQAAGNVLPQIVIYVVFYSYVHILYWLLK